MYRVGETLSMVTTPQGIELRTAAPEFEAAAREVMLRRKRALRELLLPPKGLTGPHGLSG